MSAVSDARHCLREQAWRSFGKKSGRGGRINQRMFGVLIREPGAECRAETAERKLAVARGHAISFRPVRKTHRLRLGFSRRRLEPLPTAHGHRATKAPAAGEGRSEGRRRWKTPQGGSKRRIFIYQ